MSFATPRFSRFLAVLVVTVMIMLAMPVHKVYADTPAPETVAEELTIEAEQGAPGVASEAGPDDGASDVDGDGKTNEGGAISRSGIVETSFPFSMIGFRGSGAPTVSFRVSEDGHDWSGWKAVEALDDIDGPDPDSPESADSAVQSEEWDWVGEPHWVNEAQWLEILVEDGTVDDVKVTVIDSMGLSETPFRRVARHLSGLTTQAPAEASTSPGIVTRAQWGANESWRKGTPSYATVRHSVLHHTAGSNTYSRAEAPGVVRGIYHWHTQGNGWNDIGYNLLVDRYGTVYEGRAGGLTRGVVGAHAAGWNSGSFGISLIGNFDIAAPPKAAIDSAVQAIAWKYRIHGLNPDKSATLYRNNRTIPTLVGHRDVGQTACPGRYVVAQMDSIRSQIESAVAASYRGWTPVAGDWTGDGKDSVGWYRDGVWRLYPTLTPGVAPVVINYGSRGDLPLVGDWNADGRDTFGIVRDGEWHLRRSLTPGPGQIVFRYGRVTQGDVPIVGDWTGDGRDTVGIIRDGDWHLRDSLSGGPGEIVFRYGRILQGDRPLIGDWDRNGRDTIGIVRDGDWHLRYSLSGGPAERVFRYGRVLSGDVPLIGDWNGDGRSGVGIVRDGVFHLRNDQSPGSAQIEFIGM